MQNEKQTMFLLTVSIMLMTFTACGRHTVSSEENSQIAETDLAPQEKEERESENIQPSQTGAVPADMDTEENKEEMGDGKMKIEIGSSIFTATLENNEAALAFLKMMSEKPVVIEMNDYAGFEKVGNLGTTLPSSNRQMTTQAGDIVLYNDSQIVLFYGSNSWSYTKLAQVDDLTGWKEALGTGSVTITFSAE